MENRILSTENERRFIQIGIYPKIFGFGIVSRKDAIFGVEIFKRVTTITLGRISFSYCVKKDMNYGN